MPDLAHARRGVIGLAAWCAAGLVFLALLSCNDRISTILPGSPSTVSAVEGFVRVGGRRASVVVGARDAESPNRLVAYTRADSTGWYRLALPANVYWIEVDPVGPSSGGRRDTVSVSTETRRLDHFRGTLDVRLTTPPAADGESFRCELEQSGSRHGARFAVAQNGRLEFAFPIVDPGTYRMRFTHDAFRDFWLPGTGDENAADRIRVSTLAAAVYEARLEGYASISGTVRGSWQETDGPAPFIEAFTLTSDPLGRASVAMDGSFTLFVLDVQPCRLRVSISGIDRWAGGDRFETATIFRPQTGRSIDGVSVVEGGIVCQLDGPEFVVNHRAQALLRDAAGRTYEAATGSSNSIRICNLPSGAYKLYVHGDCFFDGEPWASQWYNGADSLAAATTINITAGYTTHIAMHLESDGRIEGRILDATGAPAYSAVSLYRNGVPLCGVVRFGIQSTFSLRGLGNGDYTLAASDQNPTWWYPGTAVADSAQVLSIRNHATLSGIEWRLPPHAPKERP